MNDRQCRLSVLRRAAERVEAKTIILTNQIPITNQLDEKIALMRTTVVARTVRSRKRWKWVGRNRSQSDARLPEEMFGRRPRDPDVKTSIAAR
jgi:hypothetical protein